ncbi:hypothetical protein ABW19_dt0204759 [Dactylella cylindrospora]|nr:hypothetical protein ABW19_dt0204759 [Dactylella cylindrospora]
MRIKMSTSIPPLTLTSYAAGGTPTPIPRLVYGTAWKKDATARLVSQAIASGFRGVDTACQPRHYQEPLVGQGIEDGLRKTGLRRKDIFLQTKFTPPGGQDASSIPYDPKSPIPDQIHTSIATSIRNLRLSVLSTLNKPDGEETKEEDVYIDSVLLHSPLSTVSSTITAYQTLSTYVPTRIHHLGISNISLPLLRYLVEHPDIEIKPSVVQNRFYPDTGHDVEMRKYCRENGIVYQSFWTLTGNPELLEADLVGEVAEKVGVEREVAMYGLVVGLKGVCVLDGTTSEEHMKGDLKGLEKVEAFAEGNKEVWEGWMREFGILIGETA